MRDMNEEERFNFEMDLVLPEDRGKMRLDNSWRKKRKDNRGLTKGISLFMTESMTEEIKKLVKAGKFPNRSEFIRYTINVYFDGFTK